MERVGLNPEHYNRYPHEFSGGQRQRIGVARALALEPKLHRSPTSRSPRSTSRSRRRSSTCCDDLQRELGLTIVFIAHDLSVVAPHVRPRRGHVPRQDRRDRRRRRALRAPAPPVHRRAAVGRAGRRTRGSPAASSRLLRRRRAEPRQPAAGCRFHTRCPKAQELCTSTSRRSRSRAAATLAACHFPLTDEEIQRRVPTAAA